MKKMSRSKAIMSILLIGLAALIIGGATMSWFTDSDDVADATFTAGTVQVSADDPTTTTVPGKSIKNVNPGDCATVEWVIKNTGTKAAELRVKLDPAWAEASWAEALSLNNIAYAPAPNSGWEMYQAGDDIWLYYTGGSVRGTFDYDDEDADGLAPDTVSLPLIVVFDGALTGNDYQGATFNIDGEVHAVQASNGAPVAVWGDGWTAVNGESYAPAGKAKDYLDIVKGSSCWKGENDDDDDDECDKYKVTVTVNDFWKGTAEIVGDTDEFCEGDQVTVTATTKMKPGWFNHYYSFNGWRFGSNNHGPYESTSKTWTFTMGDSPITVKAHFGN